MWKKVQSAAMHVKDSVNVDNLISPAVPKPPSVAPRVAPSEEEVGWLKPSEADPGPGWPEPCENREELWEEELRDEEP